MPHTKVHTIATDILTDYMGVAAMFFVEDFAATVPENIAATGNEKLYAKYFTLAIINTLPASIPRETVKERLIKAMALDL